MKKCLSCGSIKDDWQFREKAPMSMEKRKKCKQCENEQSKKYHRTLNGKIKLIYAGQRSSSKTRGLPMPVYTSEEFSEWCLSNRKFLKLFIAWEESGYGKKLSPSIDRLDDSKGYSFSNIQVITFYENHKKYYIDLMAGKKPDRVKAIKQLSLDGEFIKEYYSISEAMRQTGIDTGMLVRALKNKGSKCHGFRWEYITKETHNECI